MRVYVKRKIYIYIYLNDFKAVAKLQIETESVCKRTKGNIIRSTQVQMADCPAQYCARELELVDGHLGNFWLEFQPYFASFDFCSLFLSPVIIKQKTFVWNIESEVTSDSMSFVSPALYDVHFRLARSAVSAASTASDPPFTRKAPPTDPISRYLCTQCTAYRLCSLLTFRAACRTWTTRVSSNFHLLIVPQCLRHYPTWERLTQR